MQLACGVSDARCQRGKMKPAMKGPGVVAALEIKL
jgi:hypothetical protein